MTWIFCGVRLVNIMTAQAIRSRDPILGIVRSMAGLARNRHSRVLVEKLAVNLCLNFVGMARLTVFPFRDQLHAGCLNAENVACKAVVLRERFALEFLF